MNPEVAAWILIGIVVTTIVYRVFGPSVRAAFEVAGEYRQTKRPRHLRCKVHFKRDQAYLMVTGSGRRFMRCRCPQRRP